MIGGDGLEERCGRLRAGLEQLGDDGRVEPPLRCVLDALGEGLGILHVLFEEPLEALLLGDVGREPLHDVGGALECLGDLLGQLAGGGGLLLERLDAEGGAGLGRLASAVGGLDQVLVVGDELLSGILRLPVRLREVNAEHLGEITDGLGRQARLVGDGVDVLVVADRHAVDLFEAHTEALVGLGRVDQRVRREREGFHHNSEEPTEAVALVGRLPEGVPLRADPLEVLVEAAALGEVDPPGERVCQFVGLLLGVGDGGDGGGDGDHRRQQTDAGGRSLQRRERR